MPARGGPKSEVCKGRDKPLRGEDVALWQRTDKRLPVSSHGLAEATHIYIQRIQIGLQSFALQDINVELVV